MSDTDYYEIVGGAAKKLHADWWRAVRKVRKAKTAFLKRMGTKHYYGNDRSGAILALIFHTGNNKTKIDETIWRREPRFNHHWVPRKTMPEGKKLFEEMHSFSDPSFEALVQSIIGYGNSFSDFKVHYPGATELDGNVIILAPKPDKDSDVKLVSGVKPLKASEYWRRKEAEEAKKPKAKKSA